MARKQSDYLAGLLGQETEPAGSRALPPVETKGWKTYPEVERAGEPVPLARRGAGTLLSRESALARVASGEVRQVTQLLLDPARARIWPGNARIYGDLSESGCRELIDSILAEGGQKVPAIVRRIEDDPDHDYEVIAGTRRHWAISWLRAHSYADMQFLAQVAQLDDEAAFRLADLENRARRDVSHLERSRNYAAALSTHYGGHLTRMADRLKVSKGWLSKMVKVAAIPDAVIAAFASPGDVQVKPAYALAQALDDEDRAKRIVATAGRLAGEQTQRRETGDAPYPAAEVLRRLLAAPEAISDRADMFSWTGPVGRPGLTVISANRQGVTLRLHAGSGATPAQFADALREALRALEKSGMGLQR